jgi:AraC-like DNA-binding protein/quercetin dioxygenase-like cupin family protein
MARPAKNIPKSAIITEINKIHVLSLSEDFSHPLRETGIIYAGVCELAPGYEMRRPVKDFHIVILVHAGRARYRTSQSEGVLSAGDFWVIPQPVPVLYRVEKPWTVFWFHLADTEQWAFLRAQPARIRPAHNPGPLRFAVEQYVCECVSAEPDRRRSARAYADTIAILLERELQVDADPAARRIRNALSTLWEEVSAHLSQPWDVKSLAARVHLSRRQLYRQVLRYQGMHPMEMVTRLRMLRAKDILRHWDFTLDQIAAELGYQTPFAFSRAFKKHAGVSPREYRSRSAPASDSRP